MAAYPTASSRNRGREKPLAGRTSAASDGGQDEHRVEHHVVDGEHPAAIPVVDLALQDRVDADLDPLRGQPQHERAGQQPGQPHPDRQQGLRERGEHQAADHPLLRPQPTGHDRRDHRRGQEARTGDTHDEAQQREAGLGVRGVGQGVAAQQDRRDRDHAVDEPVGPDRSQRVRRPPPLPHVPHALGQPGPDAAPALSERYDAVRTQLVGGDPQRQPGRAGEEHRGGQQQHRVRGVEQPQHERDSCAHAVRRCARRRRQRVRGHQVVGGDHVRQPGGQRGQQEPVDTDAGQHRGVQRPAVRRPGCQQSDADRAERPQAVPHEQDLPPPPAVEQHADPGPDDGERQQQDGERRRHPAGRARGLRVEEEQAGQRDLEDAVAALPGEPDREQPAKAPAVREVAQGRQDAHARRLGGGQFVVSGREHAAPVVLWGRRVGLGRRRTVRVGVRSALDVSADERLDAGPADVVRTLHRRGLHEVRRGRDQRRRRCRGPWRSWPRGSRR